MDQRALKVIRRFTAGKEPEAPTPMAVSPGTKPGAESPAKEPTMTESVTKRFYFYQARPQDAIDFEGLGKLLATDSMDKDTIIKKLQGGSGGQDTYTAAYFSWKKLIVATNIKSPQGKSLIVYECSLTPDGSREGEGTISPQGAPTTAENIEEEMSLFSRKFNKDIITIDTGPHSVFMNGEPTSETVKAMMSWHFPVGETYEKFKDVFKHYRLWIESEGRLYLPNHKMPSQEGIKDGVEGGYYPGGKDAYNKMIAPKVAPAKPEEKPEELSLEDKMKGKEPPKPVSPYEPVKKSVEPESGGDYLDRPSAIKMAAEEGDYASEPYSGGTDVVQRLVRDQHKCMKIRRMARTVIMGYLKEAQPPAVVQPGVKSTMQIKQKSKGNLPSTSQESRDQAKKLMELAKAQEEFEKQQATLQRP